MSPCTCGGRERGRPRVPRLGHRPAFRVALAGARAFERLSRLQRSRWDFPQLAIDADAKLLDQNDAPVLRDRDQDDGLRVPDDGHLVFAPIGKTLPSDFN